MVNRSLKKLDNTTKKGDTYSIETKHTNGIKIMTNSEIFKTAHALAKKLNVKVGCYAIALKIALKNIYKAIKSGRSVDSMFIAMIRVCFGAEPVYYEDSRTEYKAKTKAEAKRYIKETAANAGEIFERSGAFHFYVYK